jgi:hypothetical protein
MTSPRGYQRLFAELRRRKVFRVAAGYGAAAFVVIQVADVVFPRIPLPDWTVSFVVWLCILGFPVAIVMAWAFERTPAGVRRTEDAPAEEIDAIVAEPAARRWPSGIAALAGIGLLLAGVWTAWKVAAPARVDIAESRLAVFPFGVTGSGGLDWLTEGMPTLLSQNLFEPGATETVDPVLVMNAGPAAGGRAIELRAAGEMARDLGAGRFVVGSVTGSAGRVRMNAGLYALRDSIHAVTRGEVEGDTTQMFDLIDRLTAQLLGGSEEFGAASEELVRVASRTTESLPALKLYLEGEKQLRGGELPKARESFRRAADIDSTFALAMYRNAFTILVGLAGQDGDAAGWAERAGRHAGNLSDYDRRTLEAFTLHVNGDIVAAERGYRELAAAYPSRLDARVLLTVLLAYFDPMRGRPLDDVAGMFQQIREADPGYLCLDCVGSAIFISRNDIVGLVDDWLASARANPDSAEAARHLRSAEAMLSLATGDTVTWNRARRTLLPTLVERGSADPFSYFLTAVHSGRPALADTLVRVDFAEAELGNLPVVMDMIRGRWNAAYERLAESDPTTLVEFLGDRAFRLPLDARLPSAEDAIATCLAWDGPVAARGESWEALRPHIRLFGAALLSLQAGDSDRGLAFADSMASLPVNSVLAPIVRNAGRTVRGEAALRSGDIPAARAELGTLEWEMAPLAMFINFNLGLPRAHILRGEAAWRAGDLAEARRWLESGLAPWQIEEYALLELRRGQIDEALGNAEEARIHFARVVEALETADPALAAHREEASERLAALLEADG